MIITQTPLRISLFGGGTDFPDFYKLECGCVLAVAIDKYIYVIVNERFDDMIYINYSSKEIVGSVDDIKHDLVREAMRVTGVSGGIEITTLADIPSEGCGLGSSSSLTVGLLNALYAYRGDVRPAEQLAEEACHIEIDVLGKPIGKQDQYIAAYGNIRFIVFRADGISCGSFIPAGELIKNLMLFYTNMTRKSEDILGEQKSKIEENMDTLRIMQEQATESLCYLHEGRFDDLGRMLGDAWNLKKTLASKISNSEIDNMYRKAREAGALGGKVCGAGGGGFLLLYCRPEKQDAVRLALKDYKEMPFSFERDGSKVIFNIRR